MMKANYHTHTARCGHAEGTDEEYVLAAIERGFDELGFSDHVPWPYKNGYVHPTVRMHISQMPEYLASVRALAEYAQCEAAAEGSQVSVRFQGDLVSSDTMRLRLPEGMSCTPHTIRFYPQLSASPAMSVRFGTGEGRTLVFQLGSGRSDVR